MTQKTSFKSRMKQAFSFFRSDLRACTPLLVVFGLISAVTVVICYTICVVLGDDMTFTGALLSLNFLGVTNSGRHNRDFPVFIGKPHLSYFNNIYNHLHGANLFVSAQ